MLYVTWSLQVRSVYLAAGLWMLATFCTAMMDVILDGVSCEMGRGVAQAKAGAFQASCHAPVAHLSKRQPPAVYVLPSSEAMSSRNGRCNAIMRLRVPLSTPLVSFSPSQQSLCRLSFAVGALIVACLTGYLIEVIGVCSQLYPVKMPRDISISSYIAPR